MLVNGVSGVDGCSWRGGAFANATKRRKEEENMETWEQNQRKETSGGRGRGAAPGASAVFETADRDTKQESESPTSKGGGAMVDGGAVNRANE